MSKSQQSWVSIPPSSEPVESAGRKMKQCRIKYINNPQKSPNSVNLNSESRLFQRLNLAVTTQRLVTSALLAGCQGPSLRGWIPATTAIQARRYFCPLPCFFQDTFSYNDSSSGNGTGTYLCIIIISKVMKVGNFAHTL
jgi:hypothetical protein